MDNKLPRFKYRFLSFKRYYDYFKTEAEKYRQNKSNSTEADIEMFNKLIRLYNTAIATMKYYILAKGKDVRITRKIIQEMNKEENYSEWFGLTNLLEKTFIQQNNKSVKKLFTENYKRLISLFDSFQKSFEIKFEKELNNYEYRFTSKTIEQLLSEKQRNVLADYFKQQNNIEKVHLYGSRVCDEYTDSSDIDILIEGDFSSEEFNRFEKELNDLKIPQMVHAYNVNIRDNRATSREFIEDNIKHSLLLYQKA